MAPMTNAERQKKYRERLKQNPIKYEELRVRHLERVNQSRKRGIKKQSQQQKEITREKWRQYSARYYAKKKNKSSNEQTSDPETTEEKNKDKQWRSRFSRIQKKLKACKEKLKIALQKQENMRKQIYRLKQQILKFKQNSKDQKKESVLSSTPSEFDIITQSLGLIYKESTHTGKQVLKKVMKNSITSKHRMTTKITKAVGIKGKIRSRLTRLAKRKLFILEIHICY